jgi:surface polysaccharide O-acyltransferase-like enzyme
MMEKMIWPERLRNLATLFVIMIHVSAPIAMERTDYSSSSWWTGNLWCSIGRPAVPMFVMLSGFLLLSRTYALSEFLKKRFMRVVIPALVWIPIYSFYNYKAHNKPATILEALRGMIEGPVHYHLWFLYLIIGLYLTYPVLAPFVRQAKESEIWYFLIVCLFGTWGIKIIEYYGGFESMLYFELFTNNAIYFVGGYYLAHKTCVDELSESTLFKPWRVTVSQMRLIALALIVFGTFITAYGTWYESAQDGKFFPFFYDYLSPSPTICAVGWFLFVKYTLHTGKLAHWETEIATASFGIYLAHPLVRDWWSESGYWQDRYHPAKCIPIIVALVFIITFIAVLLIRVVPGGKKIT